MQIKTATNQEEWDKFITGHLEANFLQAWAWGEFHETRGKTVVRRIFVENGEIVAAYEGQVETAKRGTYMAVAGGPILDWERKDLVREVFEDMWKQGVENDCVFVRVRPQFEDSDQSRGLFAELGLKPAPIYLSVEFAGVLDLNKNEEEILAGASQNFRRAYRKAVKNGVEVEVSADIQDLDDFYTIQLQTARRHDFVSFSEDYLKKQFVAFAAYDEVKLYTAKFEGKILAQNFMIFYGNEASYHYGVSTELGTKLSSAPLLHIHAMREARERGMRRYNLWGITGEDETEHRFYGVSQFKRSFGIAELKYLHAHDMIIRPMAYKLSHMVEGARAKRRHV
ncbi:MAG: peptidoglycan bridge formation glycyltransferase FemA/FemB family protein [Candidatus Nomurabacteria bacterium]|nr:peptidoglycan bridge formation glycyltransferase FemA/FemB family protein [Candidatus Nomurabacteria bacterium]